MCSYILALDVLPAGAQGAKGHATHFTQERRGRQRAAATGRSRSGTRGQATLTHTKAFKAEPHQKKKKRKGRQSVRRSANVKEEVVERRKEGRMDVLLMLMDACSLVFFGVWEACVVFYKHGCRVRESRKWTSGS